MKNKEAKAIIEKSFILSKTLEIIVEEGYQKLTMRKIGNRCEFSHAKIYYYFSNKEEILLELVTSGFIELRKVTEASLEGITSPKEAFIIVLKELYNFGIKNPYYFNLMFGFDTPKSKESIIKSVDSGIFEGLTKEAMEYYNLFKFITNNYANIDDGSGQVASIFIQVAGIAWLQNSKILNEINLDSDILFDNTLERIINTIEENLL